MCSTSLAAELSHTHPKTSLLPHGAHSWQVTHSGWQSSFPALSSFSPPSGIYSFGLFTTTIFANAGQVVTGNQTPHFLSVCRPNYTALGCQSPPNTIYVTDKAACTGNPVLVTAARKAFPSKDAALSAYAVAYTVVFLF